MKYISLNQENFPRQVNESWWIVDLNNPFVSFSPVVGAQTICIKELSLGDDFFKKGTLYNIGDIDDSHGFITVIKHDCVVRMPYYVFARYFDAECFIKRVVPKNYQKTSNLEEFCDNVE